MRARASPRRSRNREAKLDIVTGRSIIGSYHIDDDMDDDDDLNTMLTSWVGGGVPLRPCLLPSDPMNPTPAAFPPPEKTATNESACGGGQGPEPTLPEKSEQRAGAALQPRGPRGLRPHSTIEISPVYRYYQDFQPVSLNLRLKNGMRAIWASALSARL